MSDTDAADRNWETTVRLRGVPYIETLTYQHRGPAEFKLDSDKNLRIEVYPENSDFEVVIALHQAGTFFAVSQEVLPEDDRVMSEEDAIQNLRDQLGPNYNE